MSPAGEQFEITADGYRVVVTEGGAALRLLQHQGRDLVDGFAEESKPSGGRGQVLIPWPNRIRDGAYTFDGVEQQLALSEPTRRNASHGLVRWAAWSVQEHTRHSVSLTYRLMAQTGYPWTLDLEIGYDLSAAGLTVTHSATNLAAAAAPYAAGMHPYLQVGPLTTHRVDQLELLMPGATRCLVDDDRKLPIGEESVEGTDFDFRVPRPIRDLKIDHAFTDLTRDARGRAVVEVRDPRDGSGVGLWVDRSHRWVQIFTGDVPGDSARRSLAVETLTAPPDAFNSGRDLLTLAAAGEPDDSFSASWGLWAL